MIMPVIDHPTILYSEILRTESDGLREQAREATVSLANATDRAKKLIATLEDLHKRLSPTCNLRFNNDH